MKDASETLGPQIITSYVLNLAGIFHSFYNTNRILNETNELSLINLIRAAKIVINSCLELLGVSAPERM